MGLPTEVQPLPFPVTVGFREETEGMLAYAYLVVAVIDVKLVYTSNSGYKY